MHYYYIYGLAISSELSLANLPKQKQAVDQKNQLRICFGSVNAQGIDNPLHTAYGFQINNHEFWLNIPFIARFLVKNGQEVIIDAVSNINEDSLSPFVLTSCMEMLLRQRGLFLAPGFAIKLGEQGIAFIGPPGQGFTMLQGGFLKKGYSFLASNLLVLNQAAEIIPGISQLEFWPETVSKMGFNIDRLKTVRPSIEKRIIPLGVNQFSLLKAPLKSMYILKPHRGDNLQFKFIKNSAKKQYLQEAIKHHSSSIYFKYSHLIDTIKITAIFIPLKGMQLQNLIQHIEKHMSHSAGAYVAS